MSRYESVMLAATVISFFLIAIVQTGWLFLFCLVSLIVLWKKHEKAVWKMKQESTKDIKI
jgi:hypothetical protein